MEPKQPPSFQNGSTLSLGRTLPTEILARIFTHSDLVHPRNQMSLQTSQPPWTLTHVCRRWRVIALNLPEIWSYIDLRGYGHFQARKRVSHSPLLNLLDTIITRSKDHPLMIRVGCTGCFDFTALKDISRKDQMPMVFANEELQAEFLRRILNHHTRWEDVVISGFPGCGLAIQGQGTMHGQQSYDFSALKKLELRPQAENVENRVFEMWKMLELFRNSERPPPLHDVSLRGLYIARDYVPEIVNFPWGKVTSLQLHDVTDDKQLLEYFDAEEETHLADRLETLHVSLADYARLRRPNPGFTPTKRTRFSKLTSLTMVTINDDHRLFLHSIQLPALQHLTLRCKGIHTDGSALTSALQFTLHHSASPLTSLHLHFSMQSFPQTWLPYERLLRTCNHVVTFDCGYISAQTLVQLGVALMQQTSREDETPVVLPCLTHLAFNYEDCEPARKYIARSRGTTVEESYHPGALFLEVAEYRAGVAGAGDADRARKFCLKDIRMGFCMDPTPASAAEGHFERYEKLRMRGVTVRATRSEHKSCW